MANNYTAVPHAYLEECECLSDAEFGSLIRALLRYSRSGEAIEPAGNARFFARRVMNQEDINRAHYEIVAEKRAVAGKQGAMMRWHPEERLPAPPSGTPETPCGDPDGKCHRLDKDRVDTEEKRKVKKRKEKDPASFDRTKEEEKEEEAPAAQNASVVRSGEGGADGRFAALYAGLNPEQRHEKALDYARRARRLREQGLDSYAALLEGWAGCGGVAPGDV